MSASPLLCTPDSPQSQATPPRRGPLLKRLTAAVHELSTSQPMQALTTVHPCFINGIRTLVHKRGLKAAQPGLFERLRKFALSNGFELVEDRRKRELECRDERRRIAPILMFAAALASNAALAEDGTLQAEGETVVPTIEIIGKRVERDQRAYLNVGGKRFISEPYGQVEMIMRVAEQVRQYGERHRVRTRGLHMPNEYTDSFVDRYDMTLSGPCEGQSFSYYEGDGFAALGLHTEDGKVVLDVLAGGGPFSSPRLWGAYDQVLNSNIRMDLMFGDGHSDGMGVLMASYKIGLMPVMKSSSKNYYGELYSRAVALAAECNAPQTPSVRQAGRINLDEIGDAS